MSQLRITEIFHSLQGEARTIGRPTVFVCLTGCPLRCQYCDTEYAFSGGSLQSRETILQQVAAYQPRLVTVTGGEPLAQPGCWDLVAALCDAGYEVSIETSGAMDIQGLDPRAIVVLDLKTPDSGEQHRNLLGNIEHLRWQDQIKFVICSRRDYQWARLQLDDLKLAERVSDVLFSPSYGQIDARELADWVVDDRLPVRFQLQLHKLLWSNEPGR